MTKDVLSVSISSVDIERIFSLARRQSSWDHAQMSSDTMSKLMMLKYYNHKMYSDPEQAVLESWNIFSREKDADWEVNDDDDSFRAELKNILKMMRFELLEIRIWSL